MQNESQGKSSPLGGRIMKRAGNIRGLVTLAVLLGLALPGIVFAQAQPAPTPAVADVALRDGGLLLGQVVSPQGVPLVKSRVTILDEQNREIATTTTDEQGYFGVQGLRGGVYQIVTPQGRGVYRLWPAGMAPPSSQQGVLMVVGNETIRGAAAPAVA